MLSFLGILLNVKSSFPEKPDNYIEIPEGMEFTLSKEITISIDSGPGKINYTALGKMTGKALVRKNEEDNQIIEMFLSHGADPNQAPKSGTTPLMQAAYKGNVKLVKLFLKYDADPNLKDKQGKTALDMAKNKNHQQVIDLLQ